MGVGLISLAVAFILAHGTVMSWQAQAPGPRMPYVDWGACPFDVSGNYVCETKPDRCVGRVVRKPVFDTGAFANKDRFGGNE